MAETQKKPLNIVIVGAGISGLTATLGLRKEGHNVTVLERSSLAKETGAAIHVAPNAHGLLKRLGVYPEALGANPILGINEYDASGTLRFDLDLRKPNSIWQHPWVLSHRVSLHEKLKELAISLEGDGPPAILKKSSKVTHVDLNSVTVTLEDGTKLSADLILGGDGVSSVTRTAVLGEELKPLGSGKNAFRFMIPSKDILDNETTAPLVKKGYMSMWIAEDRRLVMYPCENNTVMNFVGIHPTELSETKRDEGWDAGASKDALLRVYDNFGPTVKVLLSLADSSSLKVWTLLDMPRISKWVNGRLALMGDAAHPFLPHQGQGGCVAIEDAVSLIALLPKGTEVGDIPERLALYEKIRDERAHKIQESTRQSGADLKEGKKFDISEFVNYNFGHDEFDNSKHKLKKLLAAKNGPSYLRQPTSFGPSPSPRQGPFNALAASPDAKFTTYSLRFQTSATYLKTLFPSKSFGFKAPGTLAEATWRCTELSNVPWLGGGGYRFFGLWINGVQYTKKDGSKLEGSFIPVLFENLADPILTGRDELGMPKLYCDIEIRKSTAKSAIHCSWRGVEFASIEFGNSSRDPATEQNGESSPAQFDNNQFVYRYVPTVGKPGEADAEYPVVIPNSTDVSPIIEKTVYSALDSSKIKIEAKDWESLPTLHHLASDLADIPVYRIVEAKVLEGRGLDSLSNAQRLD